MTIPAQSWIQNQLLTENSAFDKSNFSKEALSLAKDEAVFLGTVELT